MKRIVLFLATNLAVGVVLTVVLSLPVFGPDSVLVGAGEVAFTALLADPR